MINTELHNTLIEKEILNKQIASDNINQKAKTELMIEKLKSVLLIVVVVFIILLMLIFLYWIFPNKHISTSLHTSEFKQLVQQYIKECNCSDKNSTKQTNNIKDSGIKESKLSKDKSNKQTKFKNGTEYIKHDNHVYKRVWKDDILVQDEKLQPSIKESREKSNEKIPQLATPK